MLLDPSHEHLPVTFTSLFVILYIWVSLSPPPFFASVEGVVTATSIGIDVILLFGIKLLSSTFCYCYFHLCHVLVK